MISPPLTDDQLNQYQEDGYLVIRGLMNEAELEKIQAIRARAEAEAVRRGGSYHDGAAHYDLEPLASDPTGQTMALRKIQGVYGSEPDFRAVAASDKVLDIVQQLIGPDVYFHSSKLMFKPARGGRRKPWHQDYAYWTQMKQARQVTVWGAVDPATRANGCIQVIPGSHKEGLIPHHQWEDYMIDESGIEQREIVYAEMAPGDVLFFDVLTLHASDPNESDQPRLSFIIDFDSKPKPKEDLPFGSTTPLRTAAGRPS